MSDRGSVMMYGAPAPPDPSNPFAPAPNPPAWPGIFTPPAVLPVRPEVAAGLAKLVPALRDALKARGTSLDADEVTAMVWLEGVAADAQRGGT